MSYKKRVLAAVFIYLIGKPNVFLFLLSINSDMWSNIGSVARDHKSKQPSHSTSTYLFHAIRLGNIKAVNELLASGTCSALTYVNDFLHTPALVLCVNGVKNTVTDEAGDRLRCQLLKMLMDHGAHVDVTDKDHMTAALFAAERGFPSCLRYLAMSGADVSKEDKDGRNAIIYSALHGRLDCLRYLIKIIPKQGLNKQTKSGSTALMLAAREKRISCLECLIKAGADLNVKDNAGFTALMFALKHNNDLAVKLLLESGAKINTVTNDRSTPLTMAYQSSYGKFKWVRKLLQMGADLTLSSLDQDFLHEMVARREKALVRRMVMNGCPPLDRPCKEHLFPFNYPVTRISPLAVALLSRRSDIARYFIANHYFTRYDIVYLCWDMAIHQRLQTAEGTYNGEDRNTPPNQCLAILNFLSRTPRSLYTLSLLAVSSALGPKSRQSDQRNSGLPTGVHPQSLGARLRAMRLNSSRPKSQLNTKKCGSSKQCKELSRREQVEHLRLPPALKRAILFETPSSRICCLAWKHIPLGEKRSHFQECLCDFCEGESEGIE